MAYLVAFVLDNPNLSTRILEAWEEAGAAGITILESTGVGRLRKAGMIDDLPLMPSLRDLVQSKETHHRTFFSVVMKEAQADKLVAATESVVGDLNEAHTGVLFVVPLLRAYGVRDQESEADAENRPAK